MLRNSYETILRRALRDALASQSKRFYRDNRTYRDWRLPFLVDDDNLTKTQPSMYDQWEMENSEIEDEHNRITDISRLPSYLRRRTEKNPIFSHPKKQSDLSFQRQRKLFALYGNECIDPSSCWFDKSDIEKIKQFEESVEVPLEISKSIVLNEKKIAEERIKERIAEIEQKMEKYPQVLAQYEKRREKQAKEKEEMKKEKADLMFEAREFFGYNLSEKDEKLQKMEMLKEEEKKKKKKELRKIQKGLM